MTSQWTSYVNAPSAGIGSYTQLQLFTMMYKPISDTLIAAGWVKAMGVGTQVDWTSPTVPSAGATDHYEIFRPGDDLFASFPFYVKIHYILSGTYYGLCPCIQIAPSFDSSGAPVGTHVELATSRSVASLTTPYTSFMRADSGSFIFSLWENSSASGGIIVALERARANSGDPSDEYITLCCHDPIATANCFQRSIMKDWTLAPRTQGGSTYGSLVYALPYYNGSYSSGFAGSVLVSPVFPNVGKLGNPMLGLAVGSQADFVEGSSIVLTAYGTTMAYRACAIYGCAYSVGNYGRILMRWE